jgi:phospholipase/carboxylesterase
MFLLHTTHVPAGTGPFPTIVALHGWGASAHDLLGLAPMIHDGEFLMLCPQGPVEVPTGPQTRGYGWFPISSGGPPDPTAVLAAGFGLRDFLNEALDHYPIDPSRVLLLGFSQGGVMAYDLALAEPGRFAGLVALSSWLPEEISVKVKPSPELERLPTLVIHGTRDPMIPIDRAHESRARLEELGICVAHGEYEMGHEISPPCLNDLSSWLEQSFFDNPDRNED